MSLRGKTLLRISVLLALLLASVEIVLAIGVTPGRHTIDFKPGVEKTLEFVVLNNENKPFTALIYVEGDLKDFVKLEKSLLDFKADTPSQKVKYLVKLPKAFEEPGDYWAKINIVELSAGIKEGAGVTATTAVVHQLRVRVPYPGKYAQAELAVSASDSNNVVFFVKVLNLGEENLNNVAATIEILGPTNEKMAVVESESVNIAAKEKEELIIPWKADVTPGRYHAIATVRYDGKVAKAEKTFSIGDMALEVKSVVVKEFRLGEVAKFDIEIESKWNEKLSGVYAKMKIVTEENDLVAEFKSPSADIEPFAKTVLNAYWDTEGVSEGTYKALLSLHYEDKSAEHELKVYVTLDSIVTEISGITARAIVKKEAVKAEMVNILMVLVFVLVIINLLWLFKFRKKTKWLN